MQLRIIWNSLFSSIHIPKKKISGVSHPVYEIMKQTSDHLHARQTINWAISPISHWLNLQNTRVMKKAKKKEMMCQLLKNEIHIPKRKEKSFLPISAISTQAKKADLRKCFEMFTGTVISSKTTKPVNYINSYSAIYLGWNYLPQNCLFSHKYNARLAT